MANDAQAVATAAIEELGIDYTLFSFTTDAAFQAYTLAKAEHVIDLYSARVGDAWSLDTPAYFEASIFETCSLLLRRLYSQYLAGVLSTEEITIGPISITPGRGLSSIVLEVAKLIDQYHNRAEVKITGETGASQSKGMIKNWTPRCRQVYI